MSLDKLIFKNKKFADLLEEIYDNQKRKEKQISTLISELRPLIEDTGDGCFSCNINYQETLFESTGPSKRIAETNVAMKVLAHIKKTT